MYQLTSNPRNPEAPTCIIKRLSDGAFIPVAPENRDYQEYLKWLEEGNTPLPAEGAELWHTEQ
jgi:hypothetical protein